MRRIRRPSAHLVTEAHRPRSEDISYRERRYLITMAIRLVCFVVAVVLFTQGDGWLAAIPAMGAIVLPYFAVVIANGGREVTSTKGFHAYEPRLPALYDPPSPDSGDDASSAGDDASGARTAGENGHPGHPGRNGTR